MGKGIGEGLRERKHRQTREAIRRAAIEAIYDQGFDAVSVDQICELAEVSQRTFFNYFGTKENVIVGGRIFEITDEVRAEFLSTRTDDVLDDVLRLVSTVKGPDVDPELQEKRRAILRDNPPMMAAFFTRIDELEREFFELLQERIALAAGVEVGDPEVAVKARMVVTMTIAIFKFSTSRWLRGQTSDEALETLRESRRLAAEVITGYPGSSLQ